MNLALRLDSTTLDPEFVDAGLRDSIPRITRLLESEARKNLSAFTRTGKTLAALTSSVDTAGATPTGMVGIRGKRGFIGRLLETGARAHEIKPKERFLVRYAGFAGVVTGVRAKQRALRRAPSSFLAIPVQRLLRFQIGGRWISTSSTRHPVMVGRHWLRRAVEATEGPAERDLQASVERAAASTAKKALSEGSAA